MENTPTEKKLEALLFYKSAPMKHKDLCEMLEITPEQLGEATDKLTARLEHSAITLIRTDTETTLATKQELAPFIEQIKRSDMKKDIGKAGAETLAIVLYRGPISRGEIDRIRGVNSGYILRNLSTRALVERTDNKKRVEYQITTSLLQHLGVSRKQDLPGFNETMSLLQDYETSLAEAE